MEGNLHQLLKETKIDLIKAILIEKVVGQIPVRNMKEY